MGIRIDGKKIQEDIFYELQKSIKDHNLNLSLGIIFVGDDSRSRQYMEVKKNFGERLGIKVDILQPDKYTTQDTIDCINQAQKEYTGIVVQLPLVGGIDTEAVLSSIHRDSDVDILNPKIHQDFLKDTIGSPVALAVKRILREVGVNISQKTNHKFVVVGNGSLVGLPCQMMLEQTGQTYSVIDERTDESDKKKLLKNATVIISGTGISGIITPDLISDHVILIDAGTSQTGAVFKGDVDHACYEKASYYSPVPGGVGPATVAILFQNLVTLALKKK